jgi:hypothetical protein
MNQETVPEKYKDYFFSMVQNAKAPIVDAGSIQFTACKARLLP